MRDDNPVRHMLPDWLRKCSLRLLGALMVSVTALAATACGRSPEISLTNRGKAPIDEVRVEYSGGSETIGRLAPGETRAFRIAPAGRSPLTVRFRGPTGSTRDQLIDAYFEAGYTGKLTIYVEHDLRITSKGELRPGS